MSEMGQNAKHRCRRDVRFYPKSDQILAQLIGALACFELLLRPCRNRAWTSEYNQHLSYPWIVSPRSSMATNSAILRALVSAFLTLPIRYRIA